MPANLNALIRYKTINSCLFGGRRRWTIQELIDACSEALAESRGRYNAVSERTIRDDIRIMRSDILGFNAPISQEKGLYFYSDSQYSILNLRITDAGLADKIYFFLLSLRTQTKHPELETILEQLCQLTKRSYNEPVIVKEADPEEEYGELRLRRCEKTQRNFDEESLQSVHEETAEFELSEDLIWGEIIEMIEYEFGV